MRKLQNAIDTSEHTIGNLFDLNSTNKCCIIPEVEDCWLWHKRFCNVNFDNQENSKR